MRLLENPSDNRTVKDLYMKEFIAPCGLKYVMDYVYYKKPYKLLTFYKYHSKRYDKYVYLKSGYRSDGATYAIDIPSCGWWIHDKLCDSGLWDDGTKLTNLQCSMVLHDILKSEGRYVRAIRWLLWTFLFGGGKCRENGMFSLKKTEGEK